MAAFPDAPHVRFHHRPVPYICPGCGRSYLSRRHPPRGTRCHHCRPAGNVMDARDPAGLGDVGNAGNAEEAHRG